MKPQGRRQFLKTLFGSASAAALMPAALCASKNRPNIIFILADDLSYRDLSAYGQQRFKTPTLDRLAQNGLRFTQAYSGAQECAPARGTLMTGLHTGHASIRRNASARGQDHLLDTDITVAEVLKEAEYTTGFAGKWGIGLPGTEGVPYKQGFDYAFGFYDQGRAHTYFPLFLYENDRKIEYAGNRSFDIGAQYERNRLPVEERKGRENRYDAQGRFRPPEVENPKELIYSHAEIERAALDFIRKNSEKPFFLYFAPQLPHGPTMIDQLGELANRSDFPTVSHKEWAAMVKRLDQSTAAILDLLRELNILDNTAIFFASDNGYSMCGYFGRGNANSNWPDDPFLRNKGPFTGGKFSTLEGGIRVPFFVYWQGKIAPMVSDEPVWLIDFFPTAAELAGANCPENLDGISLVPLMMGRPQQFKGHEFLYWENRHEQAVRMGPWKAYRKHPDEPVRLFLITEDTYSERDLAPLYPNVVKRIEQIMKEQHVDHPWYRNPGESEESFQAKRKKAEELGLLQKGRRANQPD